MVGLLAHPYFSSWDRALIFLAGVVVGREENWWVRRGNFGVAPCLIFYWCIF